MPSSVISAYVISASKRGAVGRARGSRVRRISRAGTHVANIHQCVFVAPGEAKLQEAGRTFRHEADHGEALTLPALDLEPLLRAATACPGRSESGFPKLGGGASLRH